MSAFKKIGSAVGALSTAVAPSGAAGYQIGDIRLLAADPGRGWLSEASRILLTSALAAIGTYAVRALSGAWSVINGSAYGVAYGAGVYVIATSVGAVRVGADTSSLSTVSIGFANNPQINDIWFENGIFVAISNDGGIATSPNGTDWTIRRASGGQLNRVIYGAGLFVAVGSAGLTLTSPDAITWTSRTVPGNASVYNARDISYHPSVGFIVVGGSGSNGIVWGSLDGITYTARSSLWSGPLNAVHASDGLIVAGGASGNGGVRISSDGGNTWSAAATLPAGNYRAITGSGQFYVLTGDNGSTPFVYTSTDGMNWTSVTSYTSATSNQTAQAARFLREQVFICALNSLNAIGLSVSGLTVPTRPKRTEALTAYTRIAA